jgi:ABC-type oligopeptide transport system substrate-binding subunit
MKKTIALILCLVMVLGLFAGCTKKPGGDTNPPAELKEFRTSIGQEPTVLDVSRRTEAVADNIINNTVESLVRYEDHNGEYVVCPGDAKSWESNADGSVWTFHLNEKAVWQDGVPVTAQDYVYSLQRSADPKTGSAYSYYLDPVKNFAEVNSGKLSVDQLGVRAIDDHTLEITLNSAMPAFLSMLSGTLYFAQRKDLVEKYGEAYGTDVDKYVSNGPFILESWTHNNSIVLAKNPTYWDADSVKLDKVTLSILSDTNTISSAFESGELDMINASSRDWVNRFSSQSTNVKYEYLSTYLLYVFFNCKTGPFTNEKIRKAFCMAIDAEEYNELLWDGLHKVAYGVVPDCMSVGGLNYRQNNPNHDIVKDQRTEFFSKGGDPKALLIEGMKEAGLGDDPAQLKVTFRYGDPSDFGRKVADFYIQTFKDKLGVTLNTNVTDWSIYYSAIIKDADFEMASMGWISDYDDPAEAMSRYVSNCGLIGDTYGDPEVDRLLKSAAKELDASKRMKMYGDAEKLLLDSYSTFPLVTKNNYIFVKNYVKNFPHAAFDKSGYKYIDIVK